MSYVSNQPEAEIELPPTGLFIGGEWTEAASGETFETKDPATEQVLAHVSSGGAEDIDRAVKAARIAFERGPWSVVPPVVRAKTLNKIADLIEERADYLALLESLDNGKPVTVAKLADIGSSANAFRYMAGWATRVEGQQIPLSGRPLDHFLAYTRRDPVGVVGQIVPWNFPLLMASWKVAPALAFGCATVLKPAEQTPLTALALAQIALEAGVPPGQLNVVPGFGETAGAALVAHPDVEKIAFTGSTEVGKRIVQSGIGEMKRFSLELGGKSPTIVLEDADIQKAVEGAAYGAFFNQGQICTAGSRLYVHSSVYDEVLDRLSKAAAGMKLGSGQDPTTQCGPLVSGEQLERVSGYVDIGKGEGAELVAGGERTDEPGYFYKPTILANVKQDMRIVQEEIFGPVLAASSFDDESEIAQLANDSDYGLAASIWTKDTSRAHKIAKSIKAGTVWINCHHIMDAALPFGGYKQSGWGREMGAAALELYTENKTVVMDLQA